MPRGCRGITIKEAAQQLSKSEATVRRMVRSGKLPAHIENIAPWGPTWTINETDVSRLLHPDQPLVEILPRDYETPSQMLRDVREGVVTLTTLITEGDQGLRDALGEQQAVWQTAIGALREEVEQLRHELAEHHKPGWWPWRRPRH